MASMTAGEMMVWSVAFYTYWNQWYNKVPVPDEWCDMEGQERLRQMAEHRRGVLRESAKAGYLAFKALHEAAGALQKQWIGDLHYDPEVYNTLLEILGVNK